MGGRPICVSVLHTNLPRGLEVVLPEVLVPISFNCRYIYVMMVIIINREMAVDTTSELEPPTPPSDGLERDSSPTFDAVLLRHTHAHIRPTRFHFCCTKSRRARPSATHYQTAPLRPALDSFFILFFFHHYLLPKSCWKKRGASSTWRGGSCSRDTVCS